MMHPAAPPTVGCIQAHLVLCLRLCRPRRLLRALQPLQQQRQVGGVRRQQLRLQLLVPLPLLLVIRLELLQCMAGSSSRQPGECGLSEVAPGGSNNLKPSSSSSSQSQLLARHYVSSP